MPASVSRRSLSPPGRSQPLERDLGARAQLERDPRAPERARAPPRRVAPSARAGRVVVAHVRRRREHSDAVRDRRPRDLEAVVQRRGAVVQAGQDVRVQVDHRQATIGASRWWVMRTMNPVHDADLLGRARCAEIIGSKWTALLVHDLSEGPRRFSELEHACPGISPRTLSERLRVLEEEGIVLRRATLSRRRASSTS